MTHPGIYVQGSRRRARDTEDVPTTITAFVGATLQGPTDAAALVRSFGDFTRILGPHSSGGTLAHAVKLFFDNGGQEALICRVEPASGRASVRSFSGVPCRPTVPSTTGRGLSRARRRPYRHPERTFGSNGSRFDSDRGLMAPPKRLDFQVGARASTHSAPRRRQNRSPSRSKA